MSPCFACRPAACCPACRSVAIFLLVVIVSFIACGVWHVPLWFTAWNKIFLPSPCLVLRSFIMITCARVRGHRHFGCHGQQRQRQRQRQRQPSKPQSCNAPKAQTPSPKPHSSQSTAPQDNSPPTMGGDLWHRQETETDTETATDTDTETGIQAPNQELKEQQEHTGEN